MDKKRAQTAIRIISILIILAGLVFVVKLYIIQVLRHSEYESIAERQYTKPDGFFDRGTIYFTDKNGQKITAATVKSGYLLSINPQLITDKEGTYEKIAAIATSTDKTSFLAKASKDDSYEEIQKELDEATADKISALKLPGVSLSNENWRYYPGGTLASHALGLVSYQGDNQIGTYGLEKEYNSVLERTSDTLYANFFVEIFSNIKAGISTNNDQEGDVVTTIEPTVQAALQDTLKKVNQQYSPEEVSGIIIKPKTGEIVAMASLPNFDPNNFSQVSLSDLSDPLVENVREMGSIMKAVTLTSALDDGVVTASTTYDDLGYVTADGKTIYNFDKKGRGVIDMQTVMNNSLNTGAAFMMSKIGKQKFADYLMKFGLGEKTGVDLPNEAPDLVSNLKSPGTIGYVTASYGQGIALTPMATVRALSVIANGGMLIQPHVVKEIDPVEGLPYDPNASYAPTRVVSEEATQKATKILVSLVDTALQNGKAKNTHYSVAAKTGTAQMAAPGGGYYADRYLHSFFGFFPATDPQFLIFLYQVHPQTTDYAAATLAQPFLDLSHFMINYYGIPPDR